MMKIIEQGTNRRILPIDIIFIGVHLFVFFVVLLNIRLQSTTLSNLSILGTYSILGYLYITRYRYSFLRRALVAGITVVVVWAGYEYLWNKLTGGWGVYTARAWIKILDLPLYTLLIGGLSFTYCSYLALRLTSLNLKTGFMALLSGVNALILGIIGENVYVLGGFWEYYNVRFMFWHVAAHCPLAYMVAFAFAPLVFRKLPVFIATQVVLIIVFVVSALLKVLL